MINNGDGTLTVMWNTQPDAIAYNVYRDIHDGAVDPKPIATAVDGPTWLDPEPLELGSKHTYRIQTIFLTVTSGLSAKSEAVEVSLQP